MTHTVRISAADGSFIDIQVEASTLTLARDIVGGALSSVVAERLDRIKRAARGELIPDK